MLAAVHSPLRFPQPWQHVCRAACRLLLVAGVVALSNSAVSLSIHAGVTGAVRGPGPGGGGDQVDCRAFR
jgi:hypothetical protein